MTEWHQWLRRKRVRPLSREERWAMGEARIDLMARRLANGPHLRLRRALREFGLTIKEALPQWFSASYIGH